MMKKILFVILLITVASVGLCGCEAANTSDIESDSQIETTTGVDEETQELLEKPVIKRVKTTMMDAEGSAPVRSAESIYDKNGKCLSEVIVGDRNEKYEYEYDENGNCLSKIVSGDENYKYIYEYDDNGNQISELYYSGNVSSPTQAWYMTYNEDNLLVRREDRTNNYYEIYEYDAFGKETKVTYCNPGLSDYSYLSEYNEHQRLIKQYREEEGNREICVENEYDSNGNLVKEIHYSDGQVSWSQIYEYDENGNVLKEEKSFADGTVVSTEESYNEAGQRIELVEKRNGTLVNRLTYSYDIYGNQATYIQYDAAGTVVLKKESVYAGKDQLRKSTTQTEYYLLTDEFEYNQYGVCTKSISTYDDGRITVNEYEYY